MLPRPYPRVHIWMILVLAIALNLIAPASARADAANPHDCGSHVLNGGLPLPERGQGYELEFILGPDCTLSSSPIRPIAAEKAAQDAGVDGHMSRSRFARIGSKRHLDPDYHLNAIAWDCCGVQMTRLVTDLNWTTNGSTITGWNAGGYQAYHGEYSCIPQPHHGWWPDYGSLYQSGGGTGYSSISVTSYQAWGYQGAFDACNGNVYYNYFQNNLTGYASGSPSCSFYYSLRNTAPGWHIVAQCYDPVITIVDDPY